MMFDRVVVNVGKEEFSSGQMFVLHSQVRHLQDLLFNSMLDYQQLSHLAKSKHL